MKLADGTYKRIIRPERSLEQFSRGLVLIRAILEMWEINVRLPDTNYRTPGPSKSDQINENIHNLMDEYNLTFDEWYYWADISKDAYQKEKAKSEENEEPVWLAHKTYE